MIARRTAGRLSEPPSIREVEVAARLARLRASLVPSTVANYETSGSDVPPFFVDAFTRVGITSSGTRGDANIVVFSRTNRRTNISHDIMIDLNTSAGTRTSAGARRHRILDG
jgi:hypothetical protein